MVITDMLENHLKYDFMGRQLLATVTTYQLNGECITFIESNTQRIQTGMFPQIGAMVHCHKRILGLVFESVNNGLTLTS